MEAGGSRYGLGTRALVYVGSFFIPLLGLIIFFVFRGRDIEANSLARNALIAAILGFLVYSACCGFGFSGSLFGIARPS